MYDHGGNPLVWLASIIRRKMKTIFYGKYGMLSSCDLSSFVVMLMTKACKGQRKMKTLMDFGKRAFPQPSCTLFISRSELNPDLMVIRLYFSNLDVDQTNVADDPAEYSDDFDELDDEEYSDESDEGSNGDSPKKPVSAAKMEENGEDEEAEVEYPDDFEDDSEEEVRYCN